MAQFLDFTGLKTYDKKIKQYITEKVEEVSGITQDGIKGYNLIANGTGNTPIWQQPSGYLLNTDTDEIRTVSCANFVLIAGAQVTIKFTYAFTSEVTAQLNINYTGAVPLLWKDGTAVTAANSWAACDILTISYDGENYVILDGSPSYKQTEFNNRFDSRVENQSQSIVSALKSDLVDLFYPIDIIVSFANTVDPNTQFGGTWEQIKGAFLYAAEEEGDYVLGQMGGSKNAVVVRHDHSASTRVNVAYGSEESTEAGSDGIGLVSTNTEKVDKIIRWQSTTTVSNAGEDGSGKNMPPFICVNVWKRTA